MLYAFYKLQGFGLSFEGFGVTLKVSLVGGRDEIGTQECPSLET